MFDVFVSSLQHGRYGSAVAGVLVGLAVMLAVLGRPSRRTPVDSSGTTQR